MPLFGRDKATRMSGLNGYNFTERVRRVLASARDEATRMRHEYVGTEHILLGLLRHDDSGGGVADAVLDNLGVDRAAVCSTVERVLKLGHEDTPRADLPYTSRAKKVLELAMSEARAMHHSYVGTEHLLLGLLAEERGIAAQVLHEHGLRLDAARAETARVLGQELPSEPTKVTPLPTPPHGSAPPSAAERAREELAWTRLTHALDVCARLGTPPTLKLDADGALRVSLGPDVTISVDFPPSVGLRARQPAPDA